MKWLAVAACPFKHYTIFIMYCSFLSHAYCHGITPYQKQKNETSFIFLEDSSRLQYTLKISFLISLCCIVFILQVIGIQLNFVFAKIINYRQNCKLYIAILCINSTNAPFLPTNQPFSAYI